MKRMTMRNFSKKIRFSLFSAVIIIVSVIFFPAFQSKNLRVSAEILPILVSMDHLAFGLVFPGEGLSGNLVVSLASEYDGTVSYRLVKKRKPLPPEHPEYPYGGDPQMPGYYRDLCPFLTAVSDEGEGDNAESSQVAPDDLHDQWTISLIVPAIQGHVSQDHYGGVITQTGEYGCDISVEVLEEPAPASICGYKFEDLNQNGERDEDEEGLSEWEIRLLKKTNDNDTVEVDFTLTGEDGEYCFEGVDPGEYVVEEILQDGWINVTPLTQDIIVESGENYIVNFGNVLESGGPETFCGDGIKQSPNDALTGGPNNDGYEECDINDGVPEGFVCTNECVLEEQPTETNVSSSVSSSGGGGGGGLTFLTIHTENTITADSDRATVSWFTNIPATTRVIYDTVSHPTLGSPPNYGYAFSTVEDTNLVVYHVVELTGLTPGQTYYWRAVSSASPERVGKEVSFKTLEEQTVQEGSEEEAPSETPGEETTEGGQIPSEGLGSSVSEASSGEEEGAEGAQGQVLGEEFVEEGIEEGAEEISEAPEEEVSGEEEEEGETISEPTPSQEGEAPEETNFWRILFWILIIIIIIWIFLMWYKKEEEEEGDESKK